MRTIVCILLLGALALVAVADTNVTGKWAGSFKIAGPESDGGTAFLMLKQSGSDISGTVGPGEGEQHPITKGRIEGDKITLLVEDEGHTIKFDLVVAGDRITGDAKMSQDGQAIQAKIDVTRAK
jgi:hypothetical protein